MSTMGASSFAAQELNIANVARDYHDHRTYNNHDTSITIKSTSRIEPLDRLLANVAHGALHDSAERGPDAPKCHPETRNAVQKDIMGWIEQGEQENTPKRILWLSGPAGSGKTAIAGTIADECYKKGMLAASFFFSAFAGPRNGRWSKPLIPTLAYSLLQHESIVGYKEQVLAVIERDPMVFEKHLDQQLDKLILEPLRKAPGRLGSQTWPKVIIVDGLDECQGRNSKPDGDAETDDLAPGSNAQKEILAALSRACADSSFPFRIIVASRPEPSIRHFFTASLSPILRIFLDDKYDPDADIRLFLEAVFNDIRRRYNLPSAWVSQEVVDLLVQEASGQFIYAATVIRFVNNPIAGPPQERLNQLLEWRHLDHRQPFAPLDALYSRILRSSPDPLLAVKWLHLINGHYFMGTLYTDPHLYYKGLLESYASQTEYVLGALTSLVGLVDENGKPSFYFYHKSLLDFLGDPHRSSDLHVDKEEALHFIQDQYYRVFQARGLRFNVADSPSSPPSRRFLKSLCVNLHVYIEAYHEYTAGDVEWWLANLPQANESRGIVDMFTAIHWQCKWYKCLPTCDVWRKGLLRHCREHGWRLPTKREKLRDRFKRLSYSDALKALQPPEGSSTPSPVRISQR